MLSWSHYWLVSMAHYEWRHSTSPFTAFPIICLPISFSLFVFGLTARHGISTPAPLTSPACLHTTHSVQTLFLFTCQCVPLCHSSNFPITLFSIFSILCTSRLASHFDPFFSAIAFLNLFFFLLFLLFINAFGVPLLYIARDHMHLPVCVP